MTTLRARNGVNTDLLHPIFVRRLAALFADPRCDDLYVYSGVRTYAHQKQLYDDYVAGRRDDVAANPDRVLGERTYFGQTGVMFGSKHMVQERLGGWGYACDLAGYNASTEAIAREYGLVRTVPSEKWHYEPDPRVTTPYDSTPEEPFMALTDAEQEELLVRVTRCDGELDEVLKNQAALAKSVAELAAAVSGITAQVVGPKATGVKLTEWQRQNLVELLGG